MKDDHLTKQLQKTAVHARIPGKQSQHILKSRNLLVLVSIAAICFGLASTPTIKANESGSGLNPLQHSGLEFAAIKERGQPTPEEIPWDDAFIKLDHWDKLPAGRWHIESQTDGVTKHTSDEVRDFLGGPARIVRVRMENKTNSIQSIEVIWASYSLSLTSPTFGNMDEMNAKERRQEEKAREEKREANLAARDTFQNASEAALEYLKTTLETKCGKPEANKIGKHKDLTVEVLDYKTPHGTTVRLFVHESKGGVFGKLDGRPILLMASIHKTDFLENQNRRLLSESAEDFNRSKEAGNNVQILPNGDTVIKNLPMHEQGAQGACSWASGSMILEYWGSPIPFEILTQRTAEFNGTDRAGAQLYGAADDTRLRVKSVPIQMAAIANEIDAGRPMKARRVVKGDRQDLHRTWRDASAADPNFEIPKESRKEREEKWPKLSDQLGGHASVITGYNKKKGVILVTESWGEGHRNYRVGWDEFKATCRGIETFIPK